MNNKKYNVTNSRNNSHPAHNTSAVWQAYNEMLSGESMLAEIILLGKIFQDVPATEYRYLTSKFTGVWWKPFNCPVRHAGLGTLACRGNNRAIERLYNRGEATGIQIAHAMIECSLDPKPNPAFMISAQEKVALLQTYALETDVFCRSGHAYYPSLAWLNNRTRRAVRFFNQHAKARSENHSAVDEAVTAPTENQLPSVKWPDRLYDFQGVSSSLVYAES